MQCQEEVAVSTDGVITSQALSALRLAKLIDYHRACEYQGISDVHHILDLL